MRMRIPVLSASLLATALVLLGGGLARAAERQPGEITRAPSAKRMVLERQALLVNAFARYLEQRLGIGLLSPVGEKVALELAPVGTDGTAAGLVAVRHNFGADDGGASLLPGRMSAALSARSDSVKLTFRLRW
jgi:hypothetical protein